MRGFKFFKGQIKELIFLSDNRERLPLSERWMWITEPSITVSDFDYNTGAIIDMRHQVVQYHGSFNNYIGNIILDSRLFYIFDITMNQNGQLIDIPHGTTFGEMGIYNWDNNFTILSVII